MTAYSVVKALKKRVTLFAVSPGWRSVAFDVPFLRFAYRCWDR